MSRAYPRQSFQHLGNSVFFSCDLPQPQALFVVGIGLLIVALRECHAPENGKRMSAPTLITHRPPKRQTLFTQPGRSLVIVLFQAQHALIGEDCGTTPQITYFLEQSYALFKECPGSFMVALIESYEA